MSQDVNARIEQLEAEVRDLRAQVAQDRGEPTADRKLSRRALLGGAAAAGAGIAGAALSAVPAGATTDFMLYGSPNDAGTTNTSLTSTHATTLTLSNGTSTKVPLNLAPSATALPPASGEQNKGDLFVGSGGRIFICIASGIPGTWKAIALVGNQNTDMFGFPTVFTNSSTAAVQVSAGGATDVPPLFIAPSLNAGPPAANSHSLGEVHIDSTGALFTCIGVGNPGTWVRHAPFVPLAAPSRVYDSRAGQANPSGSPQGTLAFNAPARTINCSPAVPVTATTILFNLAVTSTAGANAGALLMWAAGASQPVASSINWSGAGQTLANAVTSACDSSQDVQVRCVASTGSSTHFIIDVIGYYT